MIALPQSEFPTEQQPELENAADAGPTLRARWETQTRWYEVHVSTDLLGHYVLRRHWGGLTNALGGSMMEIIVNEAAARERIAEIDSERVNRKPAYRRIF